jgi:hypothetical protein
MVRGATMTVSITLEGEEFTRATGVGQYAYANVTLGAVRVRAQANGQGSLFAILLAQMRETRRGNGRPLAVGPSAITWSAQTGPALDADNPDALRVAIERAHQDLLGR